VEIKPIITEASTILEQNSWDETNCSQMFPDVGRDKNHEILFSTPVLRGYAYLSQIMLLCSCERWNVIALTKAQCKRYITVLLSFNVNTIYS